MLQQPRVLMLGTNISCHMLVSLLVPPKTAGLPGLAHWGLHKDLRMPSNSMSRKLSQSVSCCSVMDPIPISAYCKANLFRFAHSEKDYLLQLLSDVGEAVGLARRRRARAPRAAPSLLPPSSSLRLRLGGGLPWPGAVPARRCVWSTTAVACRFQPL